MNASVEERLRRALAQHAGTTTTAPDGWRRIRTRIEGSGRLRRPDFWRWGVLVPAAAAAVGVMIVAVVLAGSGDDATVHVAGGRGRLYLAPTGVDGSFHLVAADSDPRFPSPAGHYRAYRRRAPDGVALQASAVVVVPGDWALIGAIPEPRPLQVLGRDLTVTGDDAGTRTLSWTQADGRSAAVITFGLSQPDLVILGESLLRGDAATTAPVLPPGFVAIREGALVDGLPTLSFSTWEAAPGRRFTVNVSDVPGITIDDLAWWLPGGRATKVRGTTAIYAAHPEGALAWIERPGTTVSVYGTGMSEKELTAIAENLRPVDAAAWRDLVARAPGEGPGAQTRPARPPVRVLHLRDAPLRERRDRGGGRRHRGAAPGAHAGRGHHRQRARRPPLPGPTGARPVGAALPGRLGGPAVAYGGGAARRPGRGLLPGRAPRARRRRHRHRHGPREPGSGLWDVEFTLTTERAARFAGLYREAASAGRSSSG